MPSSYKIVSKGSRGNFNYELTLTRRHLINRETRAEETLFLASLFARSLSFKETRDTNCALYSSPSPLHASRDLICMARTGYLFAQWDRT